MKNLIFLTDSFLSFVNAVLKKTSHIFCVSDEGINEDGENRDEERWKQDEIDDKAEEEMAKMKPLLHIEHQARLLLFHPKSIRPLLPALRRT